MNKGVCKKSLILGVFCLAFVSLVAAVQRSDSGPKGNIIGFIFAKDGTTPLPGAVVKFKNLGSGVIYESSRSDDLGVFKLQGIESGVYTYGITIAQGDFNADNVVGIKVGANETAKMSIALRPYGKNEAAAVTEIYKDKDPSGESLVAVIADFDYSTHMGQLQMVKGLIRVNDRIHAKGPSTDFYQEVQTLKIGDSTARQILGSQAGFVKLEKSVQKGDRVYLVQNKKVFPFFLAPAGVAAVIAGNQAITYGVVRIRDEGDPVSAYKN
jgi:hypothetical protein